VLIVGAKGFAKEVLEVLNQAGALEGVAFFDDVSPSMPTHLFDQFPVLREDTEVLAHFSQHGSAFALGLGGPILRRRLAQRFTSLGGTLTSTISPRASIGRFGNVIGAGANLMTGTVITSDCSLGRGCLVNLNCTIGHDSKIGNWCDLSPGVHLSGHTRIGDFCSLGTGSVVIPKITIGRNVVVGAGAVVTRDVPDNSLVVGIPGKVARTLDPVEGE
jgi:sugar O-acyltransferase (sialic acid O-acetyltransferase NeuD family)